VIDGAIGAVGSLDTHQSLAVEAESIQVVVVDRVYEVVLRLGRRAALDGG
jgi:hypothetical protein